LTIKYRRSSALPTENAFPQRFPTWSVTIEVEFLPSLLNRNEVVEIFETAGFREGLGDWRPKFGRFSVK